MDHRIKQTGSRRSPRAGAVVGALATVLPPAGRLPGPARAPCCVCRPGILSGTRFLLWFCFVMAAGASLRLYPPWCGCLELELPGVVSGDLEDFLATVLVSRRAERWEPPRCAGARQPLGRTQQTPGSHCEGGGKLCPGRSWPRCLWGWALGPAPGGAVSVGVGLPQGGGLVAARWGSA